jgi:hypothetical protein
LTPQLAYTTTLQCFRDILLDIKSQIEIKKVRKGKGRNAKKG